MSSGFVVSCSICGAERRITRSQGAASRPKICKACQLETQRKMLAHIMRRPYLPTRPTDLPVS